MKKLTIFVFLCLALLSLKLHGRTVQNSIKSASIVHQHIHGAKTITNNNGSITKFDEKNKIIEKVNFPGITIWRSSLYPVVPEEKYEAIMEFTCTSLVPGAAVSMQFVALDKKGVEITRIVDNIRNQQLYSIAIPQKRHLQIKAPNGTKNLQVELKLAGNPVTIKIDKFHLGHPKNVPLDQGLYAKNDPMPPKNSTLKSMAKIKPAEAKIVQFQGSPVLYIDGKPVTYKAYKGVSDFHLTMKNGVNIILTHGGGSSLYWYRNWDKQAYIGNGKFDFSRLEDTLLRIYAANSDAKVIVSIETDPDNDWLNAHPENIYTAENGLRGIARYTSFKGFGKTLKSGERWAWSYASEAYQQHIITGLKALCQFLRNSPAGNIVIGFSICGGHDGQFVQWKYGDPSGGQADYSESFQQALRLWLREKYVTDEALQKAWKEPNVTLNNARVFTGEQWKKCQPILNDEFGLQRKIIDCRKFISISTARMLRRFGNTLKTNFGRPCVIQTWYSSPLWRQISRLASKELSLGGIDIVAQVSDYAPPRLIGSPGASANYTIANSNLRGLLFVQELDHRTWRSQLYSNFPVAKPSTPKEFRAQLLRDAGWALASGAEGFYFYDMLGSWYHDSQALSTIKEACRMADWAKKQRGKVPQNKVAVFLDEQDLFYLDNSANGGAAKKSFMISGLTPDYYMLDDINNPNLPEYKLYIVFSPITINKTQLDNLAKKAYSPGKVLMVSGPVGICGPLKNSATVLKRFNLKVQDCMYSRNDVVEFNSSSMDKLLDKCTGRLGGYGISIGKNGVTYLNNPIWAKIIDKEAKTLGYWSGTQEPGLVVKRSKHGTIVYTPQIAGVTPQFLNNLAKEAGITPYVAPNNSVAVGNGIIAGHRLAEAITVRFDKIMKFYSSQTGEQIGSGKNISLECTHGDTNVVLYEPK